MQLSRNFTLEELTVSQEAARRGLDNTPGPDEMANLKQLAILLEEVRLLLGHPILVSSAYRSSKVNSAVGGSKNSAHMRGLAADFTCPGYGSVYEVATRIRDSRIAYDQLIHEFGAWVHIGLAENVQRRQNLSIFKGTGYLPGILEAA